MLRLFSVRACESSGFPLKLTPMEIENLLTSRSSIVLVCRAVVDNLRWSIATESTSDVEFQKLLQAGPKKNAELDGLKILRRVLISKMADEWRPFRRNTNGFRFSKMESSPTRKTFTVFVAQNQQRTRVVHGRAFPTIPD